MLYRARYLLKFIIIFLMIFSFGNKSFAVSEISGEKNGNYEIIYLEKPEQKLKNVIEKRKNKPEETEKSIYKEENQNFFNLFRIEGYQFKKGPVKSQRISFFTHGGLNMSAQRGEPFHEHMDYAANEITFTTLFADNKTKFDLAYNFTRTRKYNSNLWAKFSAVELSHKINEHQEVIIGQARIPNGYEGGMSSSRLKFITRSQIARTFGNSITNTVKNKGNYKYINYEAALSDGSRYWQQLFGGGEITVLASVKPLAKYDEKYGDLRIGGSIDHGRSHGMGFTVVGGHILYNYKKLIWNSEYQYANNSAGVWYNRGKAHGLYSSVGYSVTPNIEILARYDFFQNLENYNVSTEYGTGINYYITPEAKLMLNYILAKDDTNPAPSHKIYMGVDIKYYSLIDKIFERL